jgi:hypothetical protein
MVFLLVSVLSTLQIITLCKAMVHKLLELIVIKTNSNKIELESVRSSKKYLENVTIARSLIVWTLLTRPLTKKGNLQRSSVCIVKLK